MIVCPNCSHQNPEGATQCEACYTPLPTTMACPNCGATVQSDAAFCGQCGYNLQVNEAEAQELLVPVPPDLGEDIPPIPQNLAPEPLPDALIELEPIPALNPMAEVTLAAVSPAEPEPAMEMEQPDLASSTQNLEISSISSEAALGSGTSRHSSTQLQNTSACLVHVQTSAVVELPQHLPVVHLGKPNQLIPPDIDVSGFPNSEIVSRTHADIRVEADNYYIEDTGSSNGTYINNIPLQKGNRHRLRPGDRISLGKGDLVSFIFQQSQ
ncbi:MAG: FHA domain-containing protein [Oscillatoriales cyanobacterium RM2_1_1]|nr:FHA domain-containing protein [Oscillatoriales cyanobacterium SM2_3_0]NJO44669.1 FHA domain-containing protein [Oscillatoriales cyanobacterium RM2_1_1]